MKHYIIVTNHCNEATAKNNYIEVLNRAFSKKYFIELSQKNYRAISNKHYKADFIKKYRLQENKRNTIKCAYNSLILS